MTLERARQIAGDRATVNRWGPQSLRITGCFHRDAVKVALEIAAEAHPQTPQLPPGWPGRHVAAPAGLVAVYL
jgi:hypothetical protein